jgi:beta-hydroxylase
MTSGPTSISRLLRRAEGEADAPSVLGDPELDRLLHRDGFVKLPLIPRPDADRLRAEFLRLQGGAGDGFYSDLTVPDPPYRREVTEVLGAALDGTVRDRFPGYEPFLHNFLCKFPGEDSELYLHRDWMYVDERRGDRTYVAWIALEDVDGENGQLQVLRSSHRLDDCLRGTDLTPEWLSCEDVIRQRLLWIPVKAGECVVFDNSLVHCSAPNRTGRPRVVAAVGMRPAGVPLVHFRRVEGRTAVRYDIDEEFFQTRTPQELLADAPDLPIVETAPFRPRDLDAAALAKELDRGAVAKLDRLQKGLHDVRVTVPRRARDLATAAIAHTPEPGAIRAAARSVVAEAPSKAAIAVLGVNEAVIDRLGPDTPAVWDPHGFEWAAGVEAAYPDVRAEVEALLQGPTEIPHIEDVTGGIPQGNEGPWRSFILMHQGRWIDWNCARCPATTALVRSIPGLTMAGFSVLEPGTHITEHRGPNKGALRYQLGVIVPGEDGDCRIRVGDEMLIWREGEGVAFDFTVPHEAWNDSDGIRVLLMLEVVTPLPWYLDGPNRLAQHAMSWFPTTRGVESRLKRLEPALRRAAS